MSDDFPAGWNKTVTDLIAESKKTGRSVGPPETEWALAYECSLLRPWARFPLDGDIYEALEDTPISFLTHWRAPFTDGGSGTLPKGTKVRVKVFDNAPNATRVYASPLDADVVERLLVSEADRTNPKYGGFSLSISIGDLNKWFSLVKTEHR